jgi:hypothetical protein
MTNAVLGPNHEVVPVPFLEAALWWKTHDDDRVVGRTRVFPFDVSTVFLVINHGFRGTPRWFETMIFGHDDSNERAMDRYTTWDEAEAGHVEMVRFAGIMADAAWTSDWYHADSVGTAWWD